MYSVDHEFRRSQVGNPVKDTNLKDFGPNSEFHSVAKGWEGALGCPGDVVHIERSSIGFSQYFGRESSL